MYDLAGETMLITGGAMGMGRLFLQRTVVDEARVVIWDVNQAAMGEAVQQLKSRGAQARARRVDSCSVEEIELTGQGPPEG